MTADAHARALSRAPRRAAGLLALAAIACLASACASTGVVPSLAAGSLEDPPEGLLVRIAAIEDARTFQETAGTRMVPTLTDDARTPAQRARVVGRGRNTNGQPGPNVFLEPPQTVESLVGDATTRALRAAGFRVVERQDDPDWAKATELRITIDALWMMQNPRFSSPYAAYESEISIAAPLPGLELGKTVEAGSKVVRGGFNRSMWRQALEQGLDDHTERATEVFGDVLAAVEALPAGSLAPASLAVITQPRPPKEHAIDFGRYYLLAIGNDDYESLPRLKTAASDARAVARLLESAYGYETELLVDATRADLIRTLGDYREKVGPRDNLLIYYAGHGWNDEEAELAYWLPVDADPDDETNWVSNAKITSILRAMQAKHVMIVSDSCYSGTLTRGLQISRKGPDHLERLAARRTRLALASGGNEPVADGGGGQHSVFANAFLRALRENEDVIDATTLHSKIRTPIMRDAQQTPQFGPIRAARHEDGDFLFVRTD